MAAEYLACDVVGIPLSISASNQLWGAQRKWYKLGPWTLDVWMEVQSDCVEKKECGLWIKMTERLWLYCWVTTKQTYVLVLDAEPLLLTWERTKNHAHYRVSPKETIKALSVGIKAVFEYDVDTETWVERPVSIMDFNQ